MKRLPVIAVAIASLILLVPATGYARTPQAEPPTFQSLPVTFYGESPTLMEMALLPTHTESERFNQHLTPSNGASPQVTNPLDLDDDAIDAGEQELSAMPSPAGGWNGINSLTSGCQCLPPDTNGDVGPNHYFQTVNSAFQIWNKSGTVLLGATKNNTIFSGLPNVCATTNQGDPVVLHDQLADRWFFSQFAFNVNAQGNPIPPYLQCVAVSKTANPLGAWWRYSIKFPNNQFNDYAKFGVMPDGYYMTTNLFNFQVSPPAWAGMGVVALDRAKMLNGHALTSVPFKNLGVNDWGGMLPADMDGTLPPATSGGYFVEVQDHAWDPAHIPNDRVAVWKLVPNYTTPKKSTMTNIANLPSAAFNGILCNFNRNCIPQKGTTAKLDAISGQTMFRLQYRNFGAYETLLTNVTAKVKGNAGVRWYEIRVTGGTPAIYQQSTYAPKDGTSRWMGSAAMDKQGNIAIGYSKSSSTMFPGIFYAGRLAGDPLNQLTQGEAKMKAGKGSQTHPASRWGDYSMLAIDPSDGCTFWYTNEYYKPTSSANWKTWIGKFKFPSCS